MKRLSRYEMECKSEHKLAKELSNGRDMESYHFWHGVVSGYPQCCIDFFVNVWDGGLLRKRLRRDIPMYKDNLQRGRRIMCPECIYKEMRLL